MEQGITRAINLPTIHRYIGKIRGFRLSSFDPLTNTRPVRQFRRKSQFTSHANPLHPVAQFLLIANASLMETRMRRLMHYRAGDLVAQRVLA